MNVSPELATFESTTPAAALVSVVFVEESCPIAAAAAAVSIVPLRLILNREILWPDPCVGLGCHLWTWWRASLIDLVFYCCSSYAIALA